MPLSSEKHIIDQKFREGLLNHKVQPSGRLWYRIASRLSTDVGKNRNNGRILILALLMLFLGAGTIVVTTGNRLDKTGGTDSFGDQQMIKKETATTKQSVGIKYASSDKANDLKSTSRQLKKSGDKVSSIIGGLNNKSEVPLPALDNSNAIFDESTTSGDCEDYSIDYLSLKSQKLTTNSSKATKCSQTFKHATPAKSYDNPKYYVAQVSGFYVGLGQSLNNTWILDSKAIASDNLKYQPTFGTAVMVQCGYNLNNHWGMEAAWVISSQEGQKYQYLPSYARSTSLEYYQKHISFNYMQVPMMIRYKVQGWSGLTQTPIFVNYSLGLQYGRLMSYGINQSKSKPSENDFYRRNEYAVVAGLDYDFLTRNPMFFSIGVRTSFSSNLFKSDVPDDLEFNRPHNVLIGVHAALNFSMTRQQEKPVE